MHNAKVSSEAIVLNFYLSRHLYPNFVHASSEACKDARSQGGGGGGGGGGL